MATEVYSVAGTAESYSDEMVRAIGRLFLTCANSEVALRYELARLHHQGGTASVNTILLLAGMEISVLLEKIQVGVHIARPQAAAETSSVCDKIRSVFQRRNEIAHNTAVLGKGDQLTLGLVRLTATGRFHSLKTFHTKQVDEFSTNLEQHVRALSECLNAAGVTKLPPQLGLAR